MKMWLQACWVLLLAVMVEGMPKPSGGVRKARAASPKLGMADAANLLSPWLSKIKTTLQGTLDDVGSAADGVNDALDRSSDFVTDIAGHILDLKEAFLESLSGPVQSQMGKIREKLGPHLNDAINNWWDKVESGNAPRALLKIVDLSQKYLNNYGYMSKTKTSSVIGEIGSVDQEALQKPIKEFQRLAGIKITGELDSETLRYMSLSRCGVEDTLGAFPQESAAYKVKSRYVKKGKRGKKGGKNKKGKASKETERSRVKRYNLQGDKWSKTTLTYSFMDYTNDMFRKHQRSAIHRALKLWADKSSLEFKRLSDGNTKADIKIRFGERNHGDYYPFDGRGGTLAHAFFPDSGEAHFDDDEIFSHKGEATNLHIVAAHEFGHSLGLSHSTVPNSLMAPFYQGYVADFTLHPDDIAAIQAIYGKNVDESKERPDKPGTRPTAPPTRPTKKPRLNLPDICTTDLDAIMDYAKGSRSIVYGFKGSYYFKIGESGVTGSMKKIGQNWKKLPGNLNAAVHSKRTGYTYFFKGDKVYSYDGINLRSGYPKKAASLRLPSHPTAALVRKNDGMIIIMKKKNFYLFDDYNMFVREPKPIEKVWPGIPEGIDAAITWTSNGKSYFFKGNQYWRQTSNNRELDRGYPKNMNTRWLGCTSENDGEAARLSKNNGKSKKQRNNRVKSRTRGKQRTETSDRQILARLIENPNATKTD